MKALLLVIIILLLTLATFEQVSAAKTAVPRSCVKFDLQGYIDKELKAGKTHIRIPPGRYSVTPRGKEHLRLEGLDGISIDAQEVEMICTETTRAITIENCRNFTLKGLSIDYDPLPFTQGKIVKISADGLIHDIELFMGYPMSGNITGIKYEIFRPDTRMLRFGSYYGCKVTQPAKGRLRIVKPDQYRKKHPEKVGDIIAIDCGNAPGGSIPHAVFIHKSSQVQLESVKLYASNCFGFFESDCSKTVYRKCIVDRRPPETDIKKRADARIRSLNADAFHSKYAKIGPHYLACEAQFQGDDCVAINGNYHMIMEAKKNELRVLAKQSLNISSGDSVQLLSYEGSRLPDARVVSIHPDGHINDTEKAFLRKQRINERLKNNHHGALTKAFLIRLNRPVALPRGSLICSENRIGNGFKIIDCRFGFNRSRGILVKASNGLIRGNLLDSCRGESIKLAPEYWWLEAGSSVGVVIRDNVIRNCRSRGISVYSSGARGQIAPAGAHRNITITGNRVENSPAPQILITSTDQLVIKNNKILHPENHVLKLEQAIALKNCINTVVHGNRLESVEETDALDKK